jgi:hypothetical protein
MQSSRAAVIGCTSDAHPMHPVPEWSQTACQRLPCHHVRRQYKALQPCTSASHAQASRCVGDAWRASLQSALAHAPLTPRAMWRSTDSSSPLPPHAPAKSDPLLAANLRGVMSTVPKQAPLPGPAALPDGCCGSAERPPLLQTHRAPGPSLAPERPFARRRTSHPTPQLWPTERRWGWRVGTSGDRHTPTSSRSFDEECTCGMKERLRRVTHL